MRIVIVDDDLQFSKKLEKLVSDFFIAINIDKQKITIKLYQEGYTLLDDLVDGKNYDIYFLDIEMLRMDGIELAQKIKKLEVDANIVFVSAYEKYAIPSYKIRAYYYILKREYYNEIPVILKRIIQEKYQKEITQKDYYVIQNQIKYNRIYLDDILYLVREKKYIIFHCIHKGEYRERGAMTDVYCRLPHERFCYVDRACVVNLKYVSELERDIIRLKNDEQFVELAVSRRMSKFVKNELAKYWGKIW